MTREEYTIKQERSRLLSESMLNAISYISSLEATIKAQEIIIEGKTAFMEAMAQPKTCDGCVRNNTDSDLCIRCSRLCCDRYEPKVKV